MEKILLAGGTGYIGSHLQKVLKKAGHSIHVLSRTPEKDQFYWDPSKEEIDQKAFEGITAIINLTGAGIADERWTDERKEVLLKSRIKPAELLFHHRSEMPLLKTYISASGINAHGLHLNNEHIFKEADAYGDDFTSQLVKKWEEKAEMFKSDCRVVMIRTAVVLSKDAKAFKKMSKPVKMGIGSQLGKGEQWMSIIHLDDICNIYLKALEDENFSGPLNCLGDQIRNKTFMKTMALEMRKPYFFPRVPSFMLKLLFGEMADLLLYGAKVSDEKIRSLDYQMKYDDAASIIRACL